MASIDVLRKGCKKVFSVRRPAFIKYSVLFSLFVAVQNTIQASHFYGAEITWHCVKSGSDAGKLSFEVTFYANCADAFSGITSISNPLYAKWGGLATIPLSNFQRLDMDTTCGSVLPPCPYSSPNLIAYIRKSNPVLIYGIPDTAGTHFFINQCCWPSLVNAYSNATVYVKSTMYPYLNPYTSAFDTLGSANHAMCYDNSPEFAERPFNLTCLGHLRYLDYGATDPDGDSLYYAWTSPMTSATNNLTFLTNYSVNSQLPSAAINSGNQAAVLDPINGRISFKTVSPAGLYASALMVTSYRNGQKISEVTRNLTVYTINCQSTLTNAPPTITFKPRSAATYVNVMQYKLFLGQSAAVDMRTVDLGFLPGFVFQSPELNIYGSEASSFPHDSLNCLNPPCAYLDTIASSSWTGTKFQNSVQADALFRWTPSCEHMYIYNSPGPTAKVRTFGFYVYSQDNFCPIPSYNTGYFTITVIDTSSHTWPITRIGVAGNDIELEWAASSSPNFTKYAVSYRLFTAPSWNQVTTISNIQTTAYTHNNAFSPTLPVQYNLQINDEQNCNSKGRNMSVLLKATEVSKTVRLSWNNPYIGPKYFPLGMYYVERRDSLGSWSLIDSLPYGSQFHYDLNPIFGPRLYYRISSKDAYGFTSLSNEATIKFDTTNTQPPPPAGISVHPGNIQVRVFPNPFGDELHLIVEMAPDEYRLELIDINGKVCKSEELRGVYNRVRVTGLSDGMYFLRISNGSGTLMHRKVFRHP